ncbi:MAG: TRAP transporter large permease [Alphaproteobacteria bacterium]
MSDTTIVIILALLAFVFCGVHIGVALGVTAMIGLVMVVGFDAYTITGMVGSTMYAALRDYVFAVLPLFMLMGEFIAKSGVATDVYIGINRVARGVPGRLGLATVLGNAVFAFVTGVSLASAATFSRIAYPEMRRHGYNPGFALGSIAGSACLGMLIPPSTLMIVWGILTELSIGHIFLAGVLPGLILTGFFVAYVIGIAVIKPEMAGEGADRDDAALEAGGPTGRAVALSVIGLVSLVVLVLGGIWAGAFTPTEGAGVGSAGALVIGILRGMNAKDVWDAILSVGRTSAPILFLLLAAQLYSRTLAMAGVGVTIKSFFLDIGLDVWGIVALMVVIWFVMGMLIDSISIMLLTVPIFDPIIRTLGLDPIAFSIIGILAIEAGLLTPPFGLVVYTVKSTVADNDVSLGQIFAGSTAYWVMLLIVLILVAAAPGVATWMPQALL